MNPKAITPTLNPLSTRFVATWPDDSSGWQVARYQSEDGNTPPLSADDYVAGLPSKSFSEVLASFLVLCRKLQSVPTSAQRVRLRT